MTDVPDLTRSLPDFPARLDDPAARAPRDRAGGDRPMSTLRLRHSAPCPVCGLVQDLRRDGTVGKHHVWEGVGSARQYVGVCAGTGTPVTRRG